MKKQTAAVVLIKRPTKQLNDTNKNTLARTEFYNTLLK